MPFLFFDNMPFFFLAAGPVLAWGGIYFFYFQTRFQKKIPYAEIGYFVLMGIVAAFAAYIVQNGFFASVGQIADSLLGPLFRPSIFQAIPLHGNTDLLGIVAVSIGIAIFAELFKYGVLWLFALRSFGYFSAIEAVNFGVAVGLGFALADNYLVLRDFFQNPVLYNNMFAARLILGTFAQTLYGGILGYYFGLSKMHALYRYGFVARGLISAVILHSISNLLLSLEQPFFAIILLGGVAMMLFRWYEERRNFQQFLAREEYGRIAPSFLTERREMESQLFGGGGLASDHMRNLPFCPICFAKRNDLSRPCENCAFTFFLSPQAKQ